ncbi:hypothetical protein E2K93_05415 [Thalassotalea sp. HSM 43]|uniref:SPOR domain-containing protein n=1 Tax=Thalassotalea sp. HSM 43 TaxID=2552945 RepID=UPI001080A972|nr:SPOR domain-containing protein [Thalassotalea sp. HSM 43]QBY03853.1 hypothetical protein E2K93_05415 [Thalassotalea sp. HSM 43]
MAHKDYVTRNPRAKKKQRNPYKGKKNSKQAKTQGNAKVYLGLIVVVIVGFGYGLKLLKDNAPEVDTAQTTSTANDVAQSSSAPVEDVADQIAPVPQERFEYPEELTNKNVEVDESIYDVKQKGPYQMQCGSFRSKSQADQLKATIAFAGYASEVRRTQGKNGVWYKVVLGPFERKRMAEKAKHTLKSNKVNYCQIWLWT